MKAMNKNNNAAAYLADLNPAHRHCRYLCRGERIVARAYAMTSGTRTKATGRQGWGAKGKLDLELMQKLAEQA